MTELTTVLLITVLAVISPGGDFAMTMRNSYLYGVKAGMMTACGIACAIWLHIAYTLFGFGVLLNTYPSLLLSIKMIGALYLMRIGWKTMKQPLLQIAAEAHRDMLYAPLQAFKNGFFSNAFNPKTTLFVLATFTQVVRPTTPLGIQMVYGAILSLTHLLWFVFVARLVAHASIRTRLLAQQQRANRIIGGLLILIGGVLLLSE